MLNRGSGVELGSRSRKSNDQNRRAEKPGPRSSKAESRIEPPNRRVLRIKIIIWKHFQESFNIWHIIVTSFRFGLRKIDFMKKLQIRSQFYGKITNSIRKFLLQINRLKLFNSHWLIYIIIHHFLSVFWGKKNRKNFNPYRLNGSKRVPWIQ